MSSANTWPPLVDSFGRPHTYLRVSLTDRCNFRCLYCMPDEGVQFKPHDEILTFEEILRLTKLFAGLGVNKLRLTGGEPTVRRGFIDLLSELSKIEGINSKLLTTNGTKLSEYAPKLVDAGLTGVNVSLDTLDEAKFKEITRREGPAEVLDGIDACVRAGLHTKINVVVMAGVNDLELPDFVTHFKELPVTIRFIEFMPFLGNQWSPSRIVGYHEMRKAISTHFPISPIAGQPTDVAKDYLVEGYRCKVGFITSVTDSFCAGCNRIRLTADGRFKTCLFLPAQTSLRDMMRAGAEDNDLVEAIRADLKTKWQAHPPMQAWKQLDSLPMVHIGG